MNEQPNGSVSSWLGGGGAKTYTAYHIVTVFDKNVESPQKCEVARRFSDFEKLLAYLRKLPNQHIIPDLPKKRFFNTSEQVIEMRRTELEKFLKTLLRSRELRDNSVVRYFLSH